MDLILVQGSAKHQIRVEEDATVDDLAELVTVTTMIPVYNQKLIYKGIAISKDTGKKLVDLKIKNSAKIMVIGQRHDPKEEKILGKLEETHKHIEKIQRNVKEVSADLDSLKKGFMEEALVPKSVDRLKKTLLRCTEEGMKAIEELDGMSVEEMYQVARNRKKQLINKMQSILDDCDQTANEMAGVMKSK